MHIFKSLLISLVLFPSASFGVVIAYDDAADPVYTPGPYQGLNGGFGFNPWTHTPPGPNFLVYVGTSTTNPPGGGPDIDTAGRAWGNEVTPGGNTFNARRSMTTDLPIGGTYSISYDAGSIDGQETISWGLGNNMMCQFFFAAASPGFYQFTDTLSATTVPTPISQTTNGLRLTVTRDTASTYSFTAKRLSDNLTFNAGPFAYNTTTITGIRTITATNADGGAGGGHAMFINAIEATAIPEPASLSIFLPLGAVLVGRHRRES